MVLDIKKNKDPILRKKCQKVKDINSVKELILNMKETMRSAQGAGLAAPQVGELKRIIVVHFPGEEEPFCLVNPRVFSKSFKKYFDYEGCLSFPEVFLKIKRAKKIKVKALNEKGEKISLSLQGLPARIVQHEIDHLNGKPFFKRLGFFERRKWK